MNTSTEPLMKVSVADGKYTIIQEADGRLHALRYDQEWRDCVGDNLILYLASNLQVERERLESTKQDLACERIASANFLNALAEMLGCENKPDAVLEAIKERLDRITDAIHHVELNNDAVGRPRERSRTLAILEGRESRPLPTTNEAVEKFTT